MFRSNAKLFFKNKVILLVCIFAIAYCLYWEFNYIRAVLDSTAHGFSLDKEDFLFRVFRFLRYTIFIFLFLSFEFFSAAKRWSVEEVICAGYRGQSRNYLHQFGFMMFLNFMQVLLLYLLLTANHIFQGILGDGYGEYAAYIAFVFLEYIFLPCTFMILLGWCFSLFSNRIFGYAGLVLTVILLSDAGLRNILALADMTDNTFADALAELLNINARNWEAWGNSYYMISAEPYVLYRIFFWIFLTLSVLCFCLCRGRKRIVWTVLPSVGMIGCLLLFLIPHSKYEVMNYEVKLGTHDAWDIDDFYYEENEDAKPVEPMEENFRITSYKMDLSIYSALKAKVSMKLLQQEIQDTYTFTLYHGYHLKRVYGDDGKELPFSQEGDFISVESGGKAQREITMEYEGFSPYFYSSYQAANLPGFFEYYPVAGRVEVYKELEDGYEGYTPECHPEADFDVLVHGVRKFYSNLAETERNHFQGRSNALSLISGIGVREKTIDGVRFIYPALLNAWNPETMRKLLQEREQMQDEFVIPYSLKGKTVILIPEGGVIHNYTYASDHFVGGTEMFMHTSYEIYLRTGTWRTYMEEEPVSEG